MMRDYSVQTQATIRLAVACLLAAALPALLPIQIVVTGAGAQEVPRFDVPLIDQQPFDLITLTEEEGGESVKVLPIPFPGRQVPSNPRPADRLEVVLVDFQERRYEIAWRDIAQVELYEQLIYDEALQRMNQKDFATAFQNLSFLIQNYPEMPQLEQLRREFIFQSAIDSFAKGQLRQTLSALEELRVVAPGFKSREVTNALSKVAGDLIEAYQQDGKLAMSQALLQRLESQYGPDLAVVSQWKERLQAMALRKKAEATQLMREGRFREARQAAVDMINLFPELEDGQELLAAINRRHPMVRVGVMQRGSQADPASLTDWPARRIGTLTHVPLFKFLETGSEGGRYGFALGTYRLSDDRQRLILSLDPNIQTEMDAGLLAQELLGRATPGEAAYNASWAAIFESVATESANQVMVRLKRPHVLPHALLQWVLPNDPNTPGAVPADYRLDAQDGSETSFKLRGEAEIEGQPVEVIELFYSDPKEAINDLLLGEIDVLDQLYPADAERLRMQPGIDVYSYALPTTHMLIPVSDHDYLANGKFRRALMYALDREEILRGELLDSNDPDDGRLLSGPFPIGDGQSDPLAYAYNPEIRPMDYNPQLARLLLVMTTQELREAADKSDAPTPELRPLVIGCPDYELAQVAVQAMIQQWSLIGIPAEMVVLPSSREAAASECDLVYALTTMWEPATDIQRLLGSGGLAATDDPFIIQAMQRLQAARNWREVRSALQDLHQLIAYHLPVFPLWQITDRFALRTKLKGVEDELISLYQDIASWHLVDGAQLSSASIAVP